MKTLTMIAVVTLFGCGGGNLKQADGTISLTASANEQILCENKPYSDRDLHLAALDVLWPRVVYEGDIKTPERLAEARVKLAATRKWAESLPKNKIRSAYLEWIDSYQGAYDELDSKFKHPETVTTEDERREQDEQAEKERRRALAECLPKPTV